MSFRTFSRLLSNCQVQENIKSIKSSLQSLTRELHCSQRRNARIGIQGAELFQGQPKRGVELGPKVIREAGLVPELRTIGHDVCDYGNIPILELQYEETIQVASSVGTGISIAQAVPSGKDRGYSNAKNVKQVAEANRLISDWTSKILRDGRICVTLGGDHALGIGTVNGASQVHPDLAVLWIDAHSDINTPLTSGSGNIHGMSVAFALKELQAYLADCQMSEFSSWIEPRIRASNLAFIGLRDVDAGEATIMEMLGIAAYSMQDVDRHGIEKVIEMALSRISQGNDMRPIHMSYDIDSICESFIKSTGTPVPGGLTFAEGMTIMEKVHRTGRLVSLDMVEVNPLLGTDSDAVTTAQAAKDLILAAFGQTKGGHIVI